MDILPARCFFVSCYGFQAAVAMARSGMEAEQIGNRMVQEIQEEVGEAPDFAELGPTMHDVTVNQGVVTHFQGGDKGGDIYVIINQNIP